MFGKLADVLWMIEYLIKMSASLREQLAKFSTENLLKKYSTNIAYAWHGRSMVSYTIQVSVVVSVWPFM